MELVRSTLSDHDHFAAVHVTVLGVGIHGNDAHLLQRVGGRVVTDQVVHGFIDFHAIQDVVLPCWRFPLKDGWVAELVSRSVPLEPP